MNSALSSAKRLRVSPSLSLQSLDFLATGLETSSFGFSLEGTRMTATGLLEVESMEPSLRGAVDAGGEMAVLGFENPGKEAPSWGRR